MRREKLDELKDYILRIGDIIAEAEFEHDVKESKRPQFTIHDTTTNTITYAPINHAIDGLQAGKINPNIDNLISKSSAENSEIQKEELEFMRIPKNVTKRQDGRYMWREQINNTQHILYSRKGENLPDFSKRKTAYEAEQLGRTRAQPRLAISRKSNILSDLCWKYYYRYKEGKTKNAADYAGAIRNHLEVLNKAITEYTKNDIIDFYNSMKSGQKLCHQILRLVFEDALENDLIKKNIMLNVKNPTKKSKKGSWFIPKHQKLIWENRHMSGMAHEIEFYLLTGARREEAFNTTIDFDRCFARIDGTKTETAIRSVKISERFRDVIKSNWSKMFKAHEDTLTKTFNDYLEKLKIKIKGKAIHALRHSFGSNCYYLEVPLEQCKYMMGHSSIKITSDIYQTIDPTYTKEDITSIYGDFLPEF